MTTTRPKPPRAKPGHRTCTQCRQARPLIAYTRNGRRCNTCAPEPGSHLPTRATPRAHNGAGTTYDGAELRPYDGRPGAMDAYRLPSRIGGSLHWRGGRVTGLDGHGR